LTKGPDVFVDGLDGGHLPAIGRFGLIDRSAEAVPLSYSFATTETHNQIYDYGRSDETLENERILMLRLLAEEALWQQAEIRRRYRDHQSPQLSIYRRLVEGIYYGYASLPNQLDDRIQGLDRGERSLPLDSWKAFQRLHHVYYSDFLQAEPEFHITRNRGKPGLAADLLVSALWSGIHNPDTHRTAVIPAPGPYLDVSPEECVGTDAEARFKTAMDIYLSATRNLLLANRLEQCEEALDTAEAYLECAPTEELGLQYAGSLAKVRLDLQLLTVNEDLGNAHETVHAIIQSCQEKIREYEPLGALLLDLLIDKIVVYDFADYRTSNWATPEDAFAYHETLKRDVDRELGIALSECTAHDLERVADFYARFAEAKALSADALSDPAFSLKPFLVAWACFFLMERLHNMIFNLAPEGKGYHPNPHSLRVMIRVDLKLQRFFAKHREAGVTVSAGQLEEDKDAVFSPVAATALQNYFAYQAQKHLNLLTRFTNNFGAEQPSLLMLEAAIARSVHRQPAAALDLLKQADSLLTGTIDRPRLHYRLALERAKTLRQLAALSTDHHIAEAAVKSARSEASRLQALVSRDIAERKRETRQRLWVFIADRQAEG
jgi:hypothetical protein